MSQRIAIQGVGTVGGFGAGTSALLEALARGQSAPATVCVPMDGGERMLPAFTADTQPLEQFVSKRALRRIDHFSKLSLLGAHLAVEDAGALDAPRDRMGVVIATGYGATQTTFSFLDSFIDGGDSFASPTNFSNSVHNAAVAHISILLKTTGPSLTVSQFEISFASALLTARQWLLENRVDQVLVGGVDEYCSVLGYCWERFFEGIESKGIRPYDFMDQSSIVGEGAAFFLLSLEDGQNASYGCIDEIQVGNLCGGAPSISQDRALILGADGHRDCGELYQSALCAEYPSVCYSPLYGSFPAGQAMDLAIASLALRQGQLFDAPARKGEVNGGELTSVSSLKLARNGEYGTISIRM